MKFIVKSLVLLLIVLSVFANRARRTVSLNKAATKLAAQAEVYSDCFEYLNSDNDKVKKISGQWLNLDTSSANYPGSGIIVKNYKSSESFNCLYMQNIGKVNKKTRWFFSYRNFASFGSGGFNRNILKK